VVKEVVHNESVNNHVHVVKETASEGYQLLNGEVVDRIQA
jgi:hypothetical protein